MKNLYHKRWFRILPLVVLAMLLFADILRILIPSSSAASTGFLPYHDSYYGYTIQYPQNWKITHNSSHITIFIAPSTTPTCQVSIAATRKALIAQKALMGAMPQGAYSISHKTIDGSPMLAFSQYSSSAQGPDGKFASASTKKVLVAQPNSAHGVNLYTLSLDMFRAAFVRSKNVEPHTACESDFETMANSLMLAQGANGMASVVPGVLTDPNNPAIQYAEGHWSWTYYNHLSSDSHSYYCNSYIEQTLQCDPPPNIPGTDTNDNGQFDPGYFQPQFQCAEFVARALAAEGYIGLDPNLTPPIGSNSFSNYQSYNLLAVDSLYNFLTTKIGGVDIGNNPIEAVPGDIVFYPEHVSILIQVGSSASDTLVDAHNKDAHKQSYTLGYGSNVIHIVHLPSLSATSAGVTLYGSYYYNTNVSSTSTTYYNPGFYQVSSPASSIAIQPGWLVIAYQNSNGVGGLQKTFYSNAPDLRNVMFDNSQQVVDRQIASVMIYSTRICSSSSSSVKTGSIRTSASCQPPPQDCPNTAGFITDVTYPDGTAVSSGQSFNKTWRLQNTSNNCTWSGFTLNFISGVQMNVPASVSVPTTGPGQTVDITVPLVAPTNGGTYRGNWQLEDSQGVYVSQGGGGTVWVEISVPYSSGGGGGGGSGGTNSISASYPSVVTPGQHFQPQVTVTIASGQLLQSRGDMLRNVDGNLYGAWPFVAVVGTVNPGTPYTFTFYANNPIVAPSSEGTYSSVWQLWQNGAWYGSSVTITFTVKNGGGTAPGVPTLTSPSNWDYERGGATPTLCASSSDSNVQYDIQIFQGQSTPDSGWISANCWTPPTLGPYTFTWHAKVRDNSSGLESGWSDAWNFSIASQQLTMDPLTFNPPSPSAADGSIAVRSCVQGFGNVNLGLSYQINSATDGSANGDWHGFANGGNNCPDPNNPSTWGQLSSRDYADGDHLIEAIGTGPQGQTMIVTANYHLNHRRPQDTQLISPVNNVRINSDTVTFVWRPSVNAFSYQLVISANADMSSPLFNQNVGSVTSYQYTFSQDYSPLY